MEDGFRLKDSRIAIIGLGLMGGSLALALEGKCAALYGIDSDPATLTLARDKKTVDYADADPARLLPQADIVILATPVPAIIDFIQKLPSFIQKSCVVLDLGSTKRDIVQAMSTLPEHFDPIGGHPICGKEKLGLENAEAGLFENAPFVCTPLERTTPHARSVAVQIILAIGARLIEMDADEHDFVLASTSHLPFLLSSALALSTPREFASLIGTGFKSTSRLAGTPSKMIIGVLKSNRENVLNSISTFENCLNQIKSALQNEDYPQFELILNNSRAAYQLLIANY